MSNGARTDKADRLILDTRGWKVGVFEGKQTEWTEWSLQSTTAIRSSHPPTYLAMKEAEKHDYDELEDDDKMSAELFNILVGRCRRDAGEIVRSIEERHGLLAWHKLYER